jgi:hypothetical protein
MSLSTCRLVPTEDWCPYKYLFILQLIFIEWFSTNMGFYFKHLCTVIYHG